MTRPERDPAPGAAWSRIFGAAPAPLLLLSPDLVVLSASDEWLAATGTSPEHAVGRPVTDVLASSTLAACLQRARGTGRPTVAAAVRADVRRPDGTTTERWWDVRAVPVTGGNGDVAVLFVRTDDVTARPAASAGTRALEQANTELRALGARQQRTADVLAGLASTVSALAGAETRADLLRELFGHGRAALRADLLAVALLEPGGTQLAVVDTRGPETHEPRRLPLRSPVPMAVAAAGQPVFETGVSPSAAAVPFTGLRSWAALPLRTGRRPLGSVLVGWDTVQDLPEDDVRVLEAFAAQCSQAVARVARLEAERRRAHATRGLAETLQRSLLSEPPRRPQLEIAVRYRPAAREAEVGGDWYDAFVTAPGETTLVVGDVTGHDWTAAAVAGQLRSMLRGIAVALEGRDLGAVLRSLDRAVRDTGMATLATAVVARVVEPPAGSPLLPGQLRWSNAGHPPPLLVEPDGTARLLQRPSDLLLGVDPTAPRTQHTVDLRPGATLVLYTDGLVEHRDATLDDGLDRLLAAATDLSARPVDEVCDEIIARLHPELTDDIAILALRVRPADPGIRTQP
jgi:PAS domain S-box-containing protein